MLLSGPIYYFNRRIIKTDLGDFFIKVTLSSYIQDTDYLSSYSPNLFSLILSRGLLFGMTQGQCKDSVTKNCKAVLSHAGDFDILVKSK